MTIAIGRRKFICTLGSASVAWPLAARAQQVERTRRIGVLMGSPENSLEGQAYLAAFREELQKLGWTQSNNVRIDTRWSTPDDLARQGLAKELVALQPDLLISEFTPTTAALMQQTQIIPIVFVTVSDPVGSGFVASFARPGGNATGFVTADGLLGGKWLELLKEIAPRVIRVAVPFNPATTPYADFYLTSLRAAAAHFAMEAIIAAVHDTAELVSVVAAQASAPNSGLIVIPETFTLAHRVELTSLAARHSLPAVYPLRSFAELGGLLSYGIDQIDNFRRAATYADRVLRGAKPAELPVQAPVKYELVINLKTAKELSLDVPILLQQRAADIIE
jgi:putative ABC transport system substrate-binding protein